MQSKNSNEQAKEILCHLFNRYTERFLQRKTVTKRDEPKEAEESEGPISPSNAARQLANELIRNWGIDSPTTDDKREYPGIGSVATLQVKLTRLFKKDKKDQIQRIHNLNETEQIRFLVRLLYLLREEQNRGAVISIRPIFNDDDSMDDECRIFQLLSWEKYLKWSVFREAIRYVSRTLRQIGG